MVHCVCSNLADVFSNRSLGVLCNAKGRKIVISNECASRYYVGTRIPLDKRNLYLLHDCYDDRLWSTPKQRSVSTVQEACKANVTRK